MRLRKSNRLSGRSVPARFYFFDAIFLTVAHMPASASRISEKILMYSPYLTTNDRKYVAPPRAKYLISLFCSTASESEKEINRLLFVFPRRTISLLISSSDTLTRSAIMRFEEKKTCLTGKHGEIASINVSASSEGFLMEKMLTLWQPFTLAFLTASATSLIVSSSFDRIRAASGQTLDISECKTFISNVKSLYCISSSRTLVRMDASCFLILHLRSIPSRMNTMIDNDADKIMHAISLRILLKNSRYAPR